jgi:catechol 2,3-dioxygenase-like lactoylglutathione lyase family enzyme
MAENALIPELGVRDLAASLRFYRDILGFTVRYERPLEGFAFVERDGCQLMLDQIGIGRTWETGPLEAPFGRGMNLQLRVCDLDELLARVDAAKLEPFLPLEAKTYEVNAALVTQRQFCIQDPDGYLLRFCDAA